MARYDRVIRGGMIVDGSRLPRFRGDIGIKDGRIAGIGHIAGGEADETKTQQLKSIWNDPRVRFAENLTLPHLAAVLEHVTFVGHDSGISHLAAAVGCNCILLFGPTDPDVWAPQGENVRIIRAPNGDLRDLRVETVIREL